MFWVALKMLAGDRIKYRVMVFGVAFASMMMAHQMSVFWGVMRRTVNQILDVHPRGIWVMDWHVQYVDEMKPLPETALHRVRGVPGVDWAVGLFKGVVRAQNEAGNYRQVILLGVDDATLIGAPREMLLGTAADLRSPNAVVIDLAGYTYLWPGEPLRVGRDLEINERRARLVGICESAPPFQTLPVVYTRYEEAAAFALPERHALTAIILHPEENVSPAVVCDCIHAETGLCALTADAFCRRTLIYYFRFTGIPINFGIVVLLGFVVGVAVAGQNFYLFTVDNLEHFAVLKSMGVTHACLVRMIALQALLVALLGYSLGMGMAAIVIEVSTHNSPHLAGFVLPWQVMLASGLSIVTIMLLSSVVSIGRVLILDPVEILQD